MYYKEPHVIANRLIAGVQFVICYVTALSLYLVSVHRRQSVTIMSELKAALAEILGEYNCSRMCFFGDFNVDSSSTETLNSFMRDNNLSIIYSDATTLGGTNLDLVFIRNCNCIVTVSETVTSYHKPLFLSFS